MWSLPNRTFQKSPNTGLGRRAAPPPQSVFGTVPARLWHDSPATNALSAKAMAPRVAAPMQCDVATSKEQRELQQMASAACREDAREASTGMHVLIVMKHTRADSGKARCERGSTAEMESRILDEFALGAQGDVLPCTIGSCSKAMPGVEVQWADTSLDSLRNLHAAEKFPLAASAAE